MDFAAFRMPALRKSTGKVKGFPIIILIFGPSPILNVLSGGCVFNSDEMKISYNWLRQYMHLPEPAEETGNLLTRSGLEVEHVERVESVPGGLEGIVIGEVLTCRRHPEADKLSLTTVDVGTGTALPIVCGAANVAAGQKVVVATVGATLFPTAGEPFKIKKAKIRGEASEGMICAEDEIGLGTSHEGIMVLDTTLPNGTPAAKYFNLEADYIFEIGLTPNRADAASHLGVVRDLRALLKRDYCLPAVEGFRPGSGRSIEVVVENPAACPRYSGVSIEGVAVGESPEWLRKRLQSIGLTPINSIVDITNFVLHELGQPLHAFDAGRIAGGKVIVKTLPGGTPFVTLDKQDRKLHDNDLMICDGESRPMCIAGVFGGAGSGITESTTAVFLESACFSPESIRRTVQNHGLNTDASFRFARGTDPNGTVYALKRAALLICEVAGGRVASEVVDVYPQPVAHFKVKASWKNIDRLIGKRLDRQEITSILQLLDIEIVGQTEEGLQLRVPPYRVDVQREADVVEEILRIYGYDNVEIPQHMGASFLADFPAVDKEKLQRNLTQMLAAQGFFEIITNSLTKPGYSGKLGDARPGEDVEILNNLSEDLAVMRQSLLFSGLEVLAYNLNRRQKDLKLFEFGKIYYKKEGKYREYPRLALYLTGDVHAESWRSGSQPVQFHDLAQAVSQILYRTNAKNIETAEATLPVFGYGLAYRLNNREVGQAGLLKADITRTLDLDIKVPVFYAELDWEYLVKAYSPRVVYQEVSRYPEVRRDLSLVLDRQVSFRDIETLARRQERKLLKQVNVFDVYEGQNIGAGKKSYSVSFILQDENQTLTDEVIDRTMQRLMSAYEKELSATIRK
jgi:phenylalanyl-tRNA synthetase beta chain